MTYSVNFFVVTALVLLFNVVASCSRSSSHSDPMSEKKQLRLEQQENGTVTLWLDSIWLTQFSIPPGVKKPVLFPVRTTRGTTITRGYPVAPREGESTDHPHQIGVWFNFGDVNGLDFWNNSDSIPVQKRHSYGHISLKALNLSQRADTAILETLQQWQTHDSTSLLEEQVQWRFFLLSDSAWCIDRVTMLKASQLVSFSDNKEGLFAVRVAQQLESAEVVPKQVIDAGGVPITPDSATYLRGNGRLRSSSGKEGEPAIWGTFADWVCLHGLLNEDSVSLLMADHPRNTGYPGSWFTREYGLFAINNMGKKAFVPERDPFRLTLAPGEFVSFRHRFVIHQGSQLSEQQASSWVASFHRAYLHELFR